MEITRAILPPQKHKLPLLYSRDLDLPPFLVSLSPPERGFLLAAENGRKHEISLPPTEPTRKAQLAAQSDDPTAPWDIELSTWEEGELPRPTSSIVPVAVEAFSTRPRKMPNEHEAVLVI